MKNGFLILFVCLIIIYPISIFAEEPIFITKSSTMNKIIFDGKWSFETEWKQSSLKEINTENGIIYLRISHQDEFVFVFLDVLPDKQMDRIADKSIICFDTKNNKSEYPDTDDYCFVAAMGKQTGMTLQSGSKIPTNNYFKNIKNHQDMIAIGGMSDKHDRYTKTPHASYEFKIPTELIGRSDNYGFYTSVFDYNSEKVFSWPSIDSKKSHIIPSPSKWGDVISPDKTLPEMPLPLVILSVLLISVIGITRKMGFSRSGYQVG